MEEKNKFKGINIVVFTIFLVALLVVGMVAYNIATKQNNTAGEEGHNSNSQEEVKNTNISKEINVSINNTDTKSTSNKETANDEIIKALKDEKWLEKNIPDYSNYKNQGMIPMIYSKRINDMDSMPAYIVLYLVSELDFEKAILVTYKNGTVITSEHFVGTDYSTISIDINRNIIRVTGESAPFRIYYKIENYDIEKIEKFDGEKIGIEEERNYKDYNFERIVEIASINIENTIKNLKAKGYYEVEIKSNLKNLGNSDNPNYKYRIGWGTYEEDGTLDGVIVYIDTFGKMFINGKDTGYKYKMHFGDEYSGVIVTEDNYLYNPNKMNIINNSKIKAILKYNDLDNGFEYVTVVFEDGHIYEESID